MRLTLTSLLAGTLLAACTPANEPEAGDTEAGTVTTDTDAQAQEQASEETAPPPVSLTEKWKASGFNAPEGVAAAPDGAYFISNVGGDGSEKDGSGWISKVSPDGDVLAAEFATGMDAPKGMVVDRSILYVADIDRVHMVDPADGTLLNTMEIDGAQGLNDMTTWNASVLVSDSSGGRIWQINGDEASVWLEDDRLKGVNGLLGDGDRLLVATMSSGTLYEVTEAQEFSEIATGMENADGIGLTDGGYLVSAWPGQVWFVSEDGETHELLNTQEEGILQNDLTIIDGTVIVPNWLPGTVTAWSVEAAEE
ncbi:hypothetical protein [Henriciella sp.]|uniref:SMP-30/gluconolactonase/LRE family protein n=1 Tax=Henriciella sp. TaxID=1968823 RepID=UPI00263762BB|nr:hypothetical protein [Henriciella sp.]